MLVMTHKTGDNVFVGDEFVVHVLEVKGGKVKLGYTAPKNTTILREKVKERERGNDSVQDD